MLELQVILTVGSVKVWRTVGSGYPSLDMAIDEGQRWLLDDDVRSFRVVDDYGTVLHEEER